jgi:hypothetical protein
MKITELFGRRRPGRRKARKQIAAIRAKTAAARAQVATSDAMLADRERGAK